MYSTLLLHESDGVRTVTLNRPAAGNALDLAMADELLDVVANSTGARALVITGAGRAFCAGGDVRGMAAAPDRSAFLAELARRIHRALLQLRGLPVPLVAAVNGVVAGGGLGLVLAADVVISVETASFLTAYARIGLSPDCGVSALLPRVVGVRRAAQLALLDRVLTAAEALEWGLVSEVCAPDAFDERVATVTAALAAAPAGALGAAALLLRRSCERSYGDQLDDEATTISARAGTAEAGALIEAFAAR